MAVLVEGVSVVVRADAIRLKYAGGEAAFVAQVPTPDTLCADGELACVGLMTPDDARAYVEVLEREGLRYMEEGRAVDLVVVDQRTGLCAPCDWASFGYATYGDDSISVCGAQPTAVERVTVPDGWSFEQSLSARHRFVEIEKLSEELKLVRRDGDVDVYADAVSGKEFYIKRAERPRT